MLGWTEASLLGIGLAVAALLLHLRGGRRSRLFSRILSETTIVVFLFVAWQVLGKVSLGGSEQAPFDRARSIYDLQRWLHLPSESMLQQQALPHEWLVKAANFFYYFVHFNSMMVFLVWLYFRHPERYRWGRNIVVWLTAGSLLIQLAPVAPPRLLPDLGFVDTGVVFNQSIYAGRLGAVVADQLSAMPSVHMGWSLLFALVVIVASDSRWRWLVLAHPILTGYVVVITANHWWLDGVVAAFVLAAAVAIENLRFRRRRERRTETLTHDKELAGV